MCELARRKEICASCPAFRRGEVHAETWCRLLDDNHTTHHNCEGRKHARWAARLTSDRSTCRQWLDAATCPVCTIPDPAGNSIDQATCVAALAEMYGRQFTAPPDLAGDGIIYAGEGRTWPMLVLAVKLLRETGCRLPVQVWHSLPVGSELDDDPLTRLIDAPHFETRHRARKPGHFQRKTYSIAHSGFRRALWLDGDAYCVRDPTPLFELLNSYGFVYWGAGDRSAGLTNRAIFSHLVEDWAPPVQGGHYLVNCASFWRELMLARWMDNHTEAWHSGNWDEDSWRVTISALGSKYLHVAPADWQWVAYVCRWRREPYIVHRCQGKFWPGARINTDPGLPNEHRVLTLWAELTGTSPPPAPESDAQRKERLRSERRQLIGMPA